MMLFMVFVVVVMAVMMAVSMASSNPLLLQSTAYTRLVRSPIASRRLVISW